MSRKILIQQGERAVVALTKKEIDSLARSWVNMALVEGHPPSISRNLWLFEKSLADGLAPLESVLMNFIRNACECGYAPMVVRKGGASEVVAVGNERGSRWSVKQIERADYAANIVADELLRVGRKPIDLLYSERFNPNRFESVKAAGEMQAERRVIELERRLSDAEKMIADMQSKYAAMLQDVERQKVQIYRLSQIENRYDFVYNNPDDVVDLDEHRRKIARTASN